MKYIDQTKILLFVVFYLAVSVYTIAAYDPTWTRSQCTTYSSNGLKERYVYGSNKGWINNDVWDDTTVEGVDCASYVCRCLALPEYVAENAPAPYPYSTIKLIAGVPNMTEVPSINELMQWDIWVYTTDTSKHTGFFKQYSGTYIITREARSTSSGVVEAKFSKQSLVDKGARFWRRSNWVVAPQIPKVQTSSATNVSYSSVTLNGLVTDNGYATIDDAGFAWGADASCSDGWTDAALLSDGMTFNCSLTGLEPATTYYFKAQAHNRIGWGSGTVLSFKTAAAPSSSTFIIDNGQAGTSWTGTWAASGAEGFYGTNSLWARGGATYTWTFYPWPSAVYEVSMWWTEYSSRSTAAPVKINHADGVASLTVNQQTGGGKWNVLGQYSFNAVGSVTLTANGSYPTSFCADAVRFVRTESNKNPVAQIVKITPKTSQLGEYVTFVGMGTDDGVIESCEWISSIDGKFGTSLSVATSALSEGTHVISFRVCDNQQAWSAAVEDTIVVVKASREIIIDNGGAGTSCTGTWGISGASNPWGSNSLWARNGATYTWSAASLEPGAYEVFMWWTEFSSRSSDVAVQVKHYYGIADLFINQLTNGGQWNSLGHFYFDGPANITLYAPDAYPTSYCADAVKFVKSEIIPVTAGFTSSVTGGIAPLTVSFTDQSSGGGTILSWHWDFDNDGIVDSTAKDPVWQYSKAGVYTVRLVVTGLNTTDELVKTGYIAVEAPEHIIVDNDTAGTSSVGTWSVSGGENPYGADSLYARATNASYTWSFALQQGGTYEVFLWWTDFSSRGSAIPVAVTHALGTTSLIVNQEADGGQWNSLGAYRMEAGQSYSVKLTTIGDNSTASADAVRILRISE